MRCCSWSSRPTIAAGREPARRGTGGGDCRGRRVGRARRGAGLCLGRRPRRSAALRPGGARSRHLVRVGHGGRRRRRPSGWWRFPSATAAGSVRTWPRWRPCRCSDEEVIARHAAGRYRVYMLGVLARLCLPGQRRCLDCDATAGGPANERAGGQRGHRRRADRRLSRARALAAGASSDAHRRRMFDPTRAAPALLAPWRRVRFVPLAHDRWTGRTA